MRFRPAVASDLPVCRTLLHPAFRMSPRLGARLVQVWHDLLARDAIGLTIVEEPARTHPVIQGFGATVFVAEPFAREFRAKPRPYLSAIIYEGILAGGSPVLSPEEVARGNANDGLDLVVLHFGLRDHDVWAERTQRVLHCASEAFYYFHAGYRIRSLMKEVYGPGQAAYMEAGGFRLMTEFVQHAEGGVDLADEMRPRLFSIDRESIRPGAVNRLSFLFHPAKPALGLTRGVQRVLARALLDETDEQIAAALGISLDAVKKAWRRAFDQASRFSASILGDSLDTNSHRRGAEKRRHLVRYLRIHLEELRPTAYRITSPAGTERTA